MEDEAFWREFGIRHGERGNRLRPAELTEIIKQTGFEVLDFQPTEEVERDYLAAIIPRLREAIR